MQKLQSLRTEVGELKSKESSNRVAQVKANKQAAKLQQQKDEVAALLQGRGEHNVNADNLRQVSQKSLNKLTKLDSSIRSR